MKSVKKMNLFWWKNKNKKNNMIQILGQQAMERPNYPIGKGKNPFLIPYMVIFGADPEFFFTKEDEVIGSEKVWGKEAFKLIDKDFDGPAYVDYNGVLQTATRRSNITGESKFICDGVQAELNVRPADCRAYFGNEISSCMRGLKRYLKTQKDIEVNFAPLVSISEKELTSLSKESQVFGCAPSKNAYGEFIELPDASKYLFRSAGGHIHLGTFPLEDNYYKHYPEVGEAIFKYPERLVNLLDVLVGNTAVLLDRDEGNIERRKFYGRAGEFRTPPHGLEYRVLSNFWLRSYPLMSLMFGMARTSVRVLATTLNPLANLNLEKELLDNVNMKDVRAAINNNDFDLALQNFKQIQPFLEKWGFAESLHKDNISFFLKLIKEGYPFPKDPIEAWATQRDGHSIGWESFIAKNKPVVYPVGVPINNVIYTAGDGIGGVV